MRKRAGDASLPEPTFEQLDRPFQQISYHM
jgi:hypothetical protein